MKWMMRVVAALVIVASPSIAAELGKFGMLSLRIAVKDEARSIAFYKHLGMKVGRLHHPGQQEIVFEDPTQGPGIVLMSGETKLVRGTNNFLIAVPDTHAVAKALRAAGFPDIGEPHDTPSYVGLTIKDPDGNTVNLLGPLPKK
jgi:catechol 2,3-dioxygenase-like lactoylglutathione lyase family enzyme